MSSNPFSTISNNWLTETLAKMPCGTNAFTEVQLLSMAIGSLIEYYSAIDPTILNVPTPVNNFATIDTVTTLKEMQAKIACGNLLTESESLWCVAQIFNVFANNYVAPPAVHNKTYTWASGTYTWINTATSNALTLTGLLTTDIVIATLTARDATQTLVLTTKTANTLTFLLSAAGSTTVKIDYEVRRVSA